MLTPQEYVSVQEPDLLALCRGAGDALVDEEGDLQSAFASAPAEVQEFYDNANTTKGLGYWLYETTLVYLIFKRWLALEPVVWDWYPAGSGRGRRSVDLTVHDRKSHLVRWAFEAKYWMSDASTFAIKRDFEKLRLVEGARHFALTFWRTTDVSTDRTNVAKTATAEGWTSIYAAWFSCSRDPSGNSLFVMEILEQRGAALSATQRTGGDS